MTHDGLNSKSLLQNVQESRKEASWDARQLPYAGDGISDALVPATWREQPAAMIIDLPRFTLDQSLQRHAR